jgi:hypothetical protein
MLTTTHWILKDSLLQVRYAGRLSGADLSAGSEAVREHLNVVAPLRPFHHTDTDCCVDLLIDARAVTAMDNDFERLLKASLPLVRLPALGEIVCYGGPANDMALYAEVLRCGLALPARAFMELSGALDYLYPGNVALQQRVSHWENLAAVA